MTDEELKLLIDLVKIKNGSKPTKVHKFTYRSFCHGIPQ